VVGHGHVTVFQFKPIVWSNYKPQLPQLVTLGEKRRYIPLKLKQTYLNEDDDPIDKEEAKKLRDAGKERYISPKDPLLLQELQKRTQAFALWVLQGAYDYCSKHNRTIPIPESLTKHITKQVVHSIIEPCMFLTTNYTISNEPVERDNWIPLQDLYRQYLNTEQGKPQHISLTVFSKKITKHAQKLGKSLLKGRVNINGKYLRVFQNLNILDKQ